MNNPVSISPRKANKEITKEAGNGEEKTIEGERKDLLILTIQSPPYSLSSLDQISDRRWPRNGFSSPESLSLFLSPSPRGPAWSNAACPFFVRPKARFVCHTHTQRLFQLLFFFLSLGSKLLARFFAVITFLSQHSCRRPIK